jgi:hypothetical protein
MCPNYPFCTESIALTGNNVQARSAGARQVSVEKTNSGEAGAAQVNQAAAVQTVAVNGAAGFPFAGYQFSAGGPAVHPYFYAAANYVRIKLRSERNCFEFLQDQLATKDVPCIK